MTISKQNMTRYPCVVNSSIRIDTLEAKARCGGYYFIKPPARSLGRFDVKQGYEVRSPVTVLDVDGVLKPTLKTEFFNADGTVRKKTAFGVYRGDGWRFHGRLSCKWEPACLSAEEILGALGRGESITPGAFRVEDGLSRRSKHSIVSVGFLLMDLDDWSDAVPAPFSIDEYVSRYPLIAEEAAWIVESISSRSSLKPEMRFRVMFPLPFPLPVAVDAKGVPLSVQDRDGRATFDAFILRQLETYPGLALGPSKDVVRLAYGNARADRLYREFGGAISEDVMAACLEAGRREVKREEDKKARAAARAVVRQEREFAGAAGAGKTGDDPLDAFHREPVRSLLEKHGFSYLRTKGREDEYHFDASAPGRSCTVSGDILKPFSHSLVDATPEKTPAPVNVHRLILWLRYQVDLKGIAGREMGILKERLANDGWGRLPVKKSRGPRERLRAAPEKARLETYPLEAIRSLLSDDVRAALGMDVKRGERIFIHIGADTGAGKTGFIIVYVSSLLYAGMHGAGVDEAFERAVSRGKNAFRWHSRWKGWAELYESCNGDRALMEDRAFDSGCLCPYADMAEALIDSGRSARQLCNAASCPLYNLCLGGDGYLSQFAKAASADQVFTTFPELQMLLDPLWVDFAEKLQTRVLSSEGRAPRPFRDRVAVIDDASPFDLGVTYRLSRRELRQMREWRSEGWVQDVVKDAGMGGIGFKPAASGNFLSLLEEGLCGAGRTPEKIYRAIEGVVSHFQSETGLWERVLFELSRTPVYVKFRRLPGGGWQGEVRQGTAREGILLPVGRARQGQRGLHGGFLRCENKRVTAGVWYRYFLSDKELVDAGLAGYESLTDVKQFPNVSHREHGWAVSLARFIQETGCPENAAVGYEDGDKKWGWKWFLAPRLAFEKTLYLSATASPEMVERLVKTETRGVVFKAFEGKPIEWPPGCSVYQMQGGLYTEQSFYNRAGGVITGSRARLTEFLIPAVLAQLERGDKVLLLGKKDLTGDALGDVMAPVLSHENAAVINYGEMVGRNDFSSFDVVFLMFPSVPPEVVAWAARVLYRGDAKPLSFERVPGVVSRCGYFLETNVYPDERVQAVLLWYLSHYLYQGAQRLRMALSGEAGDKQVVLLTSMPVPGLTDRGVRVFSPEGLLAAGDIRKVQEFKSTEQRVKDARDAGMSVSDAGEAFGVSERTIRAVSEDDKPARDARIREMRDQGETRAVIAKEVGVSEKTVTRVLKSTGTG